MVHLSIVADGLPIERFANQADWEAWLAEHHATARGVWLEFAKKGTGVQTVVYAEAVEEALRYGWIDGQSKGRDETFYLQRFTPRTKRSRWSQINVGKVERLLAEGRMTPAGMAAVEAAKADGRWDAAYPSPSKATVPDDLRDALAANDAARAAFEALDGQNRYAILHRVGEAKRPETRARRIERFVAMLAAGERVHP